jgi:outer membrane protein OmpA-like peptidoglycan-associated protein
MSSNRVAAAFLVAALFSIATVAPARSQQPIATDIVETITVFGRPLTAVSFQRPGGWGTHMPLVATSSLAPDAQGNLDVDAKQGYVQIESTSWGLPHAATFGDEYATYVLWAVTPDGFASNLGEVLVDRALGRSRLEVTTQFPAFALFVTAEPDFAVSQPSDVIVLEGRATGIASDQRQAVRPRQSMIVSGKYDFAGYSRSDVDARSGRAYLIQASNARRIAWDLGAGEIAPTVFAHGDALIGRANASGDEGQVITLARQATQAFEDARLITAQRHAVRIVMTEPLRGDQDSLTWQVSELFDTRQAPCGIVVTMPDVLFDFDRAALRPVARERLDRLAELLQRSPGHDLMVEGHADAIGSEAYNQDLSERRAQAVRSHLVGGGVSARKISAVGRGELQPVATNATSAGRSLNRRVDIAITPDRAFAGQ